MAWTVYILRCKNGCLYTGITNDLKRRFKQHKEGKGAKYTRANPPQKIVHTEVYRTKSKAAKREAEIKGFDRSKKLVLIKGRV
jgi:putative endonuclease